MRCISQLLTLLCMYVDHGTWNTAYLLIHHYGAHSFEHLHQPAVYTPNSSKLALVTGLLTSPEA